MNYSILAFACLFLAGCTPTKSLTKYYEDNIELTQNIYNNFITVSEDIDFNQNFHIVKTSLGTAVYVGKTSTSTETYYFNDIGEQIMTKGETPSLFYSNEFKSLLQQFIYSKYQSINYYKPNSLFLSFASKTLSNSDNKYTGLIITATSNDFVKEKQSSQFIYQIDTNVFIFESNIL